jgi:SEC-C motif-containing protein
VKLEVRRNAPCPCGSGKKFKSCCLGKGDGPASTPLPGGERESALARLREFASGPEFAESRRAAEAVFRGQCAACGGDHAHRHEAGTANIPDVPEAFEISFALDVTLRNGRTPISLLLERYGSRLPRGERGYLERMRDTHLRLYQVIELASDGRPRLVDLWTGDTLWLREPPPGPPLIRWDVLATRVVEDAGGALVIDGVPYRYPVRARDVLLRALRRAHARMGRPVSEPEVIRFFKSAATTFHHVWLATVAHDAAPSAGAALVCPLVCDRAFFDVRDRVKLVRAIVRHPDFEAVRDDGTWAWMENPLLHDRTLGQLVLEMRDRLVLETWVDGALKHGRKLLGHLAGAALQFRGVEHLGVQLPLREGVP